MPGRNKSWYPVGVALIMIMLPAVSLAGDSLRVYGLEEIVVTATRIRIPFESLPLATDVITPRELELSDANSPTDAAGNLPGAFVQRTGDFGRSDIALRGLGDNGRRLSVLMDGHPVKMGIFGCTVTHSLPLISIEQVEVIKAPGSVLYGSDALGGVLNIVTSSPPEGFQVDANTTFGTYSTWKFRLVNGAHIGPVGYVVSYDHRQTDGHLPNSAYRGDDFSAKFASGPGKTGVSLFVKYFDGYKEEPARSTDPPGTESDTWNQYNRGTVDLEISRYIKGAKASLKAYDEFGEHEFSDGWHSRDHSLGALASVTGKVRDIVSLDGGVEYREQWGKSLSAPPGEWSKHEFALYGMSQTSITPRTVGTLGLRWNSDEISGSSWAPHVGLSYDIDSQTKVSLRASKGFRSPQLSELYLFPSSHTDLSPEVVWSFELGLARHLGTIGHATASVYNMKGKDLIELVEQASPPPMYKLENSGELDFTGVEVSVSLYPHEAFETRVSYYYFNPGSHTRGRPGNKLDARAIFRFAGNTVVGDVQYVGDYYANDEHEEKIKSYFVFDARVSRYVVENLEVFFSAKNLLDEEYDIYTEIPGGNSGLYRMPGRRYLLGMAFTPRLQAN